ncbi:hypothetical protein RJ639_022329 [Escallonia herrerae]|uniref:Uncharacterized protein n=1 Tax=Escallonia herrerae TaxID=1293975 RepID=A0AA88V755_9ASTE|nr:hypothetical protein RJ639_022329 [Escallonia herrerae]
MAWQKLQWSYDPRLQIHEQAYAQGTPGRRSTRFMRINNPFVPWVPEVAYQLGILGALLWYNEIPSTLYPFSRAPLIRKTILALYYTAVYKNLSLAFYILMDTFEELEDAVTQNIIQDLPN